MTKFGERGGTYQSIPDAIYEYLGQHRDVDINFLVRVDLDNNLPSLL